MLSVHQVGVPRLDLQHPYLVWWERPGCVCGSTAHSLFSHPEHTALLEPELYRAAEGLVLGARQLCKEARGVNSETPLRSCMF